MKKIIYVGVLSCLSWSACGLKDNGATDTTSINQSSEIAARKARTSSPRAFTAFESGQVRPLALSPSGARLFATNTADGRLEVFDITTAGLRHRESVPVGVEPVAVAVRSENEVWVVNHLSDSVSVVDVSSGHRSRVTRTLLVGDEPRDIVFAGPQRSRAFITTAHRGQNNPSDPQLTTPGVGRADVWVFDAANLGSSLGGTPLKIVTLFSDTPRALAVTPDGTRVYAAAFHSGNRTATLDRHFLPFNGQGLPAPNANKDGVAGVETGIIVQYTNGKWVDDLGRDFTAQMRFTLPDKDVFVIDAMASPPAQLAGAGGYYQGVGTVLFNMAVNPVNGKVYVANTDAQNLKRFEGPSILAGPGHSVRGHLHESRITVLSGTQVQPRHLNKHIDYSTCCAAIPNSENARSLAMPQGMAVTSDGKTLYVAALGSSKIGVFKTAELENNTFVPNTANQIVVSGGGPTGVVLDEARGKLYALTRFDNSISVINTATKTETAHIAMYNPEPASVRTGRRFLYDAALSSSHGDSSCASCHIYGDFDSLAWDLGNPDESVVPNPGPFIVDPALLGQPRAFNSLKGPMTTQSLRGMDNHGPMHWRGDRTGGNDAPSVQPNSGTFDEVAAFQKFAGAFPDLLGRSAPLPAAQMQQFADFILQVMYPPNPIRALNNALTADEQAGREFFLGSVYTPLQPGMTCTACHTYNLQGNAEFGVPRPGFFGSDGSNTFDFQKEAFKVTHLRNQYQKIGRFGFAFSDDFNPIDNGFMGEQIRGFGFLHDGGHDSPFRFFNNVGFSAENKFFPGVHTPGGFPVGTAGDSLRRQVEAFMFAFDSNLAPIVGQQITLTSTNAGVVAPRIALLIQRAFARECDLVVSGASDQVNVGFLFNGTGQFSSNRTSWGTMSESAVRQVANSGSLALTFTCVAPGTGERVALDRDGDGYLDGDEEDAHTDAADAASHP